MEFQEKLEQVFKENQIEIIEFKGEKDKIEYRCLTCGKVYSYKCARNLLSKITLCKDCYNPFSRWNKERLEEFKLKRLYPESDLTLIDYRGLRAPAQIKCNKCGEIEEIKNLEALMSGRKDYFCKNCEKDYNLIYNHMIEELEEGYVKLLEWHGVNSKAKFQCNRCGHIFEKNVTSNFNGKICPNCFKTHNKFSFEDAQNWLNEKGNGEYVLLQYKGGNDKSLVKHKCGFCYSTRLADFSKKRGCPKCYKQYSKGEQVVAEFLEKNNFNFIRQRRFEDLPRFSYDFSVMVGDKEILIEVQGQQHYHDVKIFDSFEQQQKRDKIKKEYCLVNNIPLIEVPYWEIKNVENFLQLKFKDYLK